MPTLYDYEAQNPKMTLVQYIFKYNEEMQRKWRDYKNEREASRNWPAHFTQRTVDDQSVSDILGLYMEINENCPASPKRPRDMDKENQDLNDTKRLKENIDPFVASADMEID